MSSLRQHEEDYANFLIGLGLQRRAAVPLADMICKFGELTDALEELVEKKTNANMAADSTEGGLDG